MGAAWSVYGPLMDTFETRVALLEEHVVDDEMTSADYLDEAESCVELRGFWLSMAKWQRRRELAAVDAILDEVEEEE